MLRTSTRISCGRGIQRVSSDKVRSCRIQAQAGHGFPNRIQASSVLRQPNPGDPERVQQESPGREPWGPAKRKGPALQGRNRLCRPCRARFPDAHFPGLTPWAFLFRPFRPDEDSLGPGAPAIRRHNSDLARMRETTMTDFGPDEDSLGPGAPASRRHNSDLARMRETTLGSQVTRPCI